MNFHSWTFARNSRNDNWHTGIPQPGRLVNPVLASSEQETFFALQNGEHLLIGLPLAIRNDLYGVMVVEEAADARRFRLKRVEIVDQHCPTGGAQHSE